MSEFPQNIKDKAFLVGDLLVIYFHPKDIFSIPLDNGKNIVVDKSFLGDFEDFGIDNPGLPGTGRDFLIFFFGELVNPVFDFKGAGVGNKLAFNILGSVLVPPADNKEFTQRFT